MPFDRKLYNKLNYTKNYPAKKEYNRKWYEPNKEKVIGWSKEYYEENKEVILPKNKVRGQIWRIENPEKIKVYNQDSKYNRNKSSNKSYHKNKHKKKHISAWRNLLKRTLEYKGVQKDKSTYSLLGYTNLQLKQRLEYQFTNKMSWDNYGIYWEIDHKKPVSLFNKETPSAIINALCNLQPLTVSDNRKKSKQFNINLI